MNGNITLLHAYFCELLVLCITMLIFFVILRMYMCHFHTTFFILQSSQGVHRALCARCAKSRLFSTTSSHGSQGPEFYTLQPRDGSNWGGWVSLPPPPCCDEASRYASQKNPVTD